MNPEAITTLPTMNTAINTIIVILNLITLFLLFSADDDNVLFSNLILASRFFSVAVYAV